MKQKTNKLEVLVDEYIERVDKKLWKINICCIESETGTSGKYLGQLKDIISSDTIRFPSQSIKLHFSEMNDAQRKVIVEYISKLPIAAKIYTFYIIEENGGVAKRRAMLSAIKHTRRLHSRKTLELKIEYADEYSKTILKPHLYKDVFEFILPDAVLNVYSKHLNEIGKSSTSSNAQFYTLLKEKIRLQVFIANAHAEYCVRDERV